MKLPSEAPGTLFDFYASPEQFHSDYGLAECPEVGIRYSLVINAKQNLYLDSWRSISGKNALSLLTPSAKRDPPQELS
ncbi:MAG: hypothetical protein WHS82_05480 [Candidatus Methanosuratincola sp.]